MKLPKLLADWARAYTPLALELLSIFFFIEGQFTNGFLAFIAGEIVILNEKLSWESVKEIEIKCKNITMNLEER
jgi:hypothetical protein